MGTGGSGPGALAAKIQAALEGVEKVMAGGSTFQIGGASMTQAQIAAELSGYLPAFTAVAQALATYKQLLAARTALEPQATDFLVNLRSALVAFHKRGNPTLTQFGMGTGKPTTPSPETMVVAAAARMLTRQRRGTLGKRQRQKITVASPPTVTLGREKTIALPTISVVPPAVEAALNAAQAAAPQPAAPAPAPAKGG